LVRSLYASVFLSESANACSAVAIAEGGVVRTAPPVVEGCRGGGVTVGSAVPNVVDVGIATGGNVPL
jgi:hypothetical protein